MIELKYNLRDRDKVFKIDKINPCFVNYLRDVTLYSRGTLQLPAVWCMQLPQLK
jgi:hypothetical protein